VFFLALGVKHEIRMRRIILPSVACPVLQMFFTFSHKRHFFRKKVIEHKMCVLIFSTNFVWNISYSKKNWARYGKKCKCKCKCKCLHVKYPSFLSDCNDAWTFWTDFRKKWSNIRLHKDPPSGSQVFTYGQTHRPDVAHIRFSQFCVRT
jgi:hypothetical protein